MVIEKFEKHGTPLGSTVTLTLNYKEVRDITNALYHYQKKNDHPEVDKDIKECYAEMSVVRDIVKHSQLQPDTAEIFVKTFASEESS